MSSVQGSHRHSTSRHSLTSALSGASGGFRSLISAKNIKAKTLPKFLRDDRTQKVPLSLPFSLAADSSDFVQSLHNAEEMSLITSHFLSLHPRISTAASQWNSKLSSDLVQGFESRRLRESRVDEIIASIFAGTGNPTEVLFTLKGETFCREDLRRVHEYSEVSRKILQAYLKSLNQLNRRLSDRQSVKIFRVSFSQQVFSKGRASLLHSKSDPLKYE